MATARPMPRPAPVTKAVFSGNGEVMTHTIGIHKSCDDKTLFVAERPAGYKAVPWAIIVPKDKLLRGGDEISDV